MGIIHIGSPMPDALALLALAGNANGQDRAPALLNTLEVQQLVKRAEPGDNARLAAHK